MYEKAHIGIYLEFQSSYSNKVEDEIKKKQKNTNKNNYSELNQLVSKKKKSSEYVLEARNVFFHFINTSNRWLLWILSY